MPAMVVVGGTCLGGEKLSGHEAEVPSTATLNDR